MAIKLSGILTDGAGEPLKEWDILLRAKRTNDCGVLTTVTSTTTTITGAYDIDVLPNKYGVFLQKEGEETAFIGEMAIFHYSLPGSINDYLLLPCDKDEYAGYLQLVKEERERAEDAASDAERSAKCAYTYAKSAKQSSIEAEQYADDARKSAFRAECSEANAGLSKDQAGQYADNAKQSEENAKKSELNAKQSEENAKESELNAKQSEENVIESEASIKEIEENIEEAELRIKTYELNAKESSLNARDSEINAKHSEENARLSELNAEKWAIKAKESQVLAEVAAGNAKESEENAKKSEEIAKNAEASAEIAIECAEQAKKSAELAEKSEESCKEIEEELKGLLVDYEPQESVTVVQEMGESVKTVMSQKAVTTEITQVQTTANAALPKKGGTMSGEIISTSANNYRMIYSNRGFFFRLDATRFYIMRTKENDPNGSYDTFRPIMISTVDDIVYIAGTSFAGGVMNGTATNSQKLEGKTLAEVQSLGSTWSTNKIYPINNNFVNTTDRTKILNVSFREQTGNISGTYAYASVVIGDTVLIYAEGVSGSDGNFNGCGLVLIPAGATFKFQGNDKSRVYVDELN